MAVTLSNSRHKLNSAWLPAVWFLTDESRTRDVHAALAALPRGTGVIFRHYGVQGRTRMAKRLAAFCRARGLIFVVAGDWRLAAHVRAHGLHLPEHDAARGPASGARAWLKRRRTVLTASAHGARGLARAHEIGADAVLLAPIYPTRSHPGRASLGLTRARTLLRRARLPVYALGGVTPDKIDQLRAAGFAGLAGIGFALNDED